MGAEDLPSINGDLHLLKLGDGQTWKLLFDILGVKTLDRATFIQDFIIPNYDNIDGSEQLSGLTWIRENYDVSLKEVKKRDLEKAKEFKQLITTTPLVLCDDGYLHPIVNMYDPKEAVIYAWLPVATASDILGKYPAAFIPANRLYPGSKIALREYGYLIASQRPLLSQSIDLKPEVKKALGLELGVDKWEQVVAHLDKLIALWAESVSNELPLADNFNSAIYKGNCSTQRKQGFQGV